MNWSALTSILQAARALVLISLLPLAACGIEQRDSSPPPPLADRARHVVHVGLEETETPGAAIAQVLSARLTDSGRHIVVLDIVAPFVKVYTRDNRLHAAFVAKGGGPGEARRPTALAVSGDSLILLADGSQSVSVYDLDGRLRGQARIPNISPLAATAPCPGEWLLYGPRTGEGGGTDSVAWLHRVRFTTFNAVEVESMLTDAMPQYLSVGLPYGLVADRNAAVVRHTLSREPRVLRLECGDTELRVVHRSEFNEAPAPERVGAGSVRTMVTPGIRAPAGLAVLENTFVYGERVPMGHNRTRVDFTLRAPERERTLSVTGDYVLHDSRPGVGVLVSTSDPVPQVFLIAPKEFLGIFPAR